MKISSIRNFDNKYSTGASLLEQAMLLPIALIFIVAIVDINSALQAYTAIQEGVSEALRCLTPTDGACTIDNSKMTARYPVTRAKAATTWQYPQFSYSATLSYLQSPAFTNASYQMSIADTPIVDVGSNNQTAFNPKFQYIDFKGRFVDYPTSTDINDENKLKSLSGSIKESDRSDYKVLDSILLGKINPLKEGIPCYKGTSYEKSVFVPNFKSSCSNNVSAVIHVNGSKSGTSSDAKGNILLYYATGLVKPDVPNTIKDLQDIPGWTSLGGREFTGDSNPDASLYTRGVNLDSLKGDSSFIDSVQEYQQDYNKIKVKRGHKIWLLFILKLDEGKEIHWHADRIKLFTDIIKGEDYCHLTCNQDLSEETKDINTDNCHAKHPFSGEEIPVEALDSIETVSPLTACSFVNNNSCSYTGTGVKQPEGTKVDGNKLFASEALLAEIKKEDPKALSCLNSKIMHLSPSGSNSADSMLAGVHNPTCDWEKKLRNEVRHHAQYQSEYDGYYSLVRNEVGTNSSETEPELECYAAKQTSSAIGSYETISGSPFLWSGIPDYCFNSKDWICDIGAPIIEGGTQGVLHDTATAKAKAERAISRTLPWAQWECDKASCASVSASAEDDRFTVSASVKVPFRTFKWLGLGDSTPMISYTESSNWEGKFAR